MYPVLFHELKYYFKNIHEAIYIYGFYIIILIIVPLGLRQELHALPELAPAMVLAGLVSSIAMGAWHVFQRDAESGVLEQYQLTPRSLYGVVLGKWLAFYIANVVPMALAAPAVLLLFRLPMYVWPGYALGILAAGTNIALISTLAAVIGVGLERARALIFPMILPLVVPVIIFGSQYLQAPAQLWQPSMLFMCAFGIFLLPLLCLAGNGCIRAGN